MTKRTVSWWVVLCLVVGITPHAQADPTPVYGVVSAMAQALIDGSPAQFNGFTQTADADYNPIYLSAYAESDANGDVASAFTSIYASWDSASAGYVQFGESGFSNASQMSSGSDNLKGSRWTYKFRAGDDGAITVNYEVDLTPDTTDATGLQGIWFVVILDDYEPVFDQVLAPGDGGTLTVPLAAGETYAVSLIPLAQFSGDLGNVTAGMVGYFDWGISEGQ